MAPRKPTTGAAASSINAATIAIAPAVERVRAFSVREVAFIYGVKKQVVGGWIRFGELRAIDVRAPGAKRPRFKIMPADLAAFEAVRANRGIAEKAAVPARRRVSQADAGAVPVGRRW